MMQRIGIIGGSGLYKMDGMENIQEISVETPFGAPSAPFITGTLQGRQVVFLARHGKGHHISPSELNFRANIWAMKELGVNWILSISAVGSLRQDYAPTDIVVIDNFVDRTNQARVNTFFKDGIVAHIQFAHPLCETVRQAFITAGQKIIGEKLKTSGTYLNMEGPQFSTLAESQLYRKWGMDLVGMTQMHEARLAREAEICYATLCLVTDFDCWHEAETGETVSVEMVLNYMQENALHAQQIIKETIALLPTEQNCSCAHALNGAIMTDRALWPKQTIEKLAVIIAKYVN